MDSLSQTLQEALLVLLTYYDDQARIIHSAVQASYFEGAENREIAAGIYAHIERYKVPPKEHLEDLFEDILTAKDEKGIRKANRFRVVISDIIRNKNEVNIKYTMDRLERFVRHQEIKKATLEIAEAVTSGQINDEVILKAELIMARALRKKISVFDAGTFFGDSTRALAFLESSEEKETFRTGVWPLDDEELGPKRQQLHLFVGLAGYGKSWWLINLGIRSLQSSHRVCHISLEMSEKQVSQRYHQGWWGIAKRDGEINFTKLRNAAKNVEGFKEGDLRKISRSVYTPDLTFNHPEIRRYLLRRRKRIEQRLNRLVIKSFPTGQLTLRGLIGYLDTLETNQKFVPDLLLIDYPQLMKLDTRNLRLELGQMVKDLRGLGVERNMAVAVVGQSSRMGLRDTKKSPEKFPVLTMDHIAEDFSQGMTADTVLTFNQTKAERELSLARIYVAKAREEEGGFTVLISQRYHTGIFCYDAARMKPAAEKLLNDFLKQGEDEEDE